MSRKLALFSRRTGACGGPIIPRPIRATSLAEAHRQLAQQHYDAERYKLARRSYRTALRIEPECIAALIGLAGAWEDDPYGSDEQAFRCYRRALKMDAANTVTLASLGRTAVRLTRDQLAKNAIAKAMRLAPGDATVLAIVVEACREAGWVKRAWQYACRARFIAPKDAAIRDLWNRVRFDRAVRQAPKVDDSPKRMVLPFLRIVGEEHGSHWRLDAM